MIVVRSLWGTLDLLWFKVYNIFESIPLFLCLMFLKSPSDVLIPVDGHTLELVTHGPVPSALVERWFERRLFVPDWEICNVDVLYSQVLCPFLFFSILQPLQILTRSTSGDFLTMQLDFRSPVGFVFNFSKTPKSPFRLIFTKIMLYIVFNLRCFLFFSYVDVGIESFLHVFRLLLPMEPWLHAVRKLPYINFSQLYFYVCTLLDCLLW